jgi:hypothetical protein
MAGNERNTKPSAVTHTYPGRCYSIAGSYQALIASPGVDPAWLPRRPKKHGVCRQSTRAGEYLIVSSRGWQDDCFVRIRRQASGPLTFLGIAEIDTHRLLELTAHFSRVSARDAGYLGFLEKITSPCAL